jgi:hypothetical protein
VSRQPPKWAKLKNLKLAPEKSQVTLFTPWTKESQAVPLVSIDGVPLLLNKTPQNLGVIFDTHWTSGPNADHFKKKGDNRIPVMNALGGTDWGNDKVTLLFTYNATIKPTLTFGPPIWAPNTKPVDRKKLQLVQNKGLCIVTGCHRASSIDHLHSETQVLPIEDRLDMLCIQYLASAMRPSHPSLR